MAGTVRTNPTPAPDAVSNTLFGPGVIDMTKATVTSESTQPATSTMMPCCGDS